MNRLIFVLFLIGIIAIGGGAAWYLVDTRNEAFGPPIVATSTPQIEEGLAIYTNGPYGFAIFYPQDAEVSYTFDASYHLGANWRANALGDSEGAPIVSILPFHTESEDSYPRYFNAMVRIGASIDPAEIERCEAAALDQGETVLPDAVIGSKTWKAFAFESAGMMQYANGVSYRTIHEGRCIALERVRTGSSYREDAPSEKDISDEVLSKEYEALSSIVESFSFAR
ncbi:MAG: hypothetical protein QG636_41 [Patescibacteria group bacterium]|jgi:hypothetical protein|nr:hypothetical protein [Patescibacteria group bacterium]